MYVEHNLTIDLQNPRKNVIHVSQDDSTRKILLTLTNGGTPYKVESDIQNETVVGVVSFGKPDGTGGQYDTANMSFSVASPASGDNPAVLGLHEKDGHYYYKTSDTAVVSGKTYYEGDGVDAVSFVAGSGNKYEVYLDGQCFTCPGVTSISVIFYTESGKMLSTFLIEADVQMVPGSDVKSTNYYNMESLRELEDSMQRLKADVQDLKENAVRTDNQTLTNEQKAQARGNIGAMADTNTPYFTDVTAQVFIVSDDDESVSVSIPKKNKLSFSGESDHRVILTGIDTPINAYEAANKGYVDDFVEDTAVMATKEQSFTGEEKLQARENIDAAATSGTYNDLTAGLANNLKATVGKTDASPYVLRTAGGTLDIGNTIKLEKLVGVSIAWNQLIGYDTMEADNTAQGIIFTKSQDGSVTISGTPDSAANTYFSLRTGLPLNHVYLLAGAEGDHVGAGGAEGGFNLFCILNNAGVSFAKQYGNPILIKPSGSGATSWALRIQVGNNTNPITYADAIKPQLFDLTLMLGPEAADAVYAREQASAGTGVAWFRQLFPNLGGYPYIEGELMSVRAAAHVTVGFNAYDHTTGTAVVVGGMAYQITGSYTGLALEGETVTPDQDGYFTPDHSGTLTVTDGDSATTCVHLVWDGERDGEYAPYEEHRYPLDATLELRGLLALENGSLTSVGDELTPDGTHTVRMVQVTYDGSSDENWVLSGSGTGRLFGIPVGSYGSVVAGKILSSRYARASIISSTTTVGIGIINSSGYNNARISIRPENPGDLSVPQFKAMLAANPVTVVYQLAAPTTGTAEAYTEEQAVDDFGVEYFEDAAVAAGTREVAVPVGHVTMYYPNLRAELERVMVEVPKAPTADGTYTLQATVSDGNKTFEWISNT